MIKKLHPTLHKPQIVSYIIIKCWNSMWPETPSLNPAIWVI